VAQQAVNMLVYKQISARRDIKFTGELTTKMQDSALQ